MDKKNCGDYEVTCSSCGRPWAVCKEKGGCSKCGDVRFCEYGRKASGCIREKQPGCPMQAVIPSVTVDTVNGIKGLSDCLVHVADINTTYYIDDQHRLLTTWGGPVSVYDYDFDDNPLNLRNQMAYDTMNNVLAIFDKQGVAYKVPISDLNNDYTILENKPQINGHELSGNKTSTELGLQSELIAGNGIEIDESIIKSKIGNGLEFDSDGVLSLDKNMFINVKLFGAKGDGSTDDTAVIQSIINNNPLRTIYFPDGIYVISSMLTTPATDTAKVFLSLSENAVLKASDSFSDDFVLTIGETGTATGYGATRNKTGINGGIIDCNGVCGGLRVRKTHMAKVLNLNVNNVLTKGVQIDESNNASSDVFMKNVDINGTNAQRSDAIGVVINGHDNNLEMVRTHGLHIGIQVNGGGNWLISCHPLYGDSTAWYEQSVGFDINANDTHLTDCYSDNFSTGFSINGTYDFEAVNLFCFWYSNDSYAHTAIKTTGNSLHGRIDGLKISFPTNGTNRGLLIDDGTSRKYPDQSYTNNDRISGRISGLKISNHNRLTYKFSDPILLSSLTGEDFQTFGGMSDGASLNKWYPLMIFNTGSETELDIKIGYSYSARISANVSSDIWFHDVKIIENRQNIQVKFGVGKISDLTDVYILYYCITDKGTNSSANWSTTTKILSRGLDNRAFILPRTSAYSIPELMGVDTIPGEISQKVIPENANSGEGFFGTTGWATTHTISIRNISESGQRPIVLFIHVGNSTGVYGIFYGEIMPINIDHMSVTPTMTIADSVLTVTTTTTSTISYVRL